MPYGNANQIVKEMAYEVLPVVKRTPVLAGVCGTDPFMLPRNFLSELKELGFAGIQNFPTVGLVDGKLRQNLEETGISFKQEVEVIALAREMDLLTTPYVFDEQETRWMTEAGADVLVAHMGCTTGGTIGVSTATPLDECVTRIQKMVDVARKIRPDVLVLCHGGPLATPDDARYVFERVKGIDGFYGASSMERLPTEIAMTQQIRDFVGLRLQTSERKTAKLKTK
jgi:predicted TIM-barrel enzyme